MEVPLQEDWEALIELLSEAFKLLGGNQTELSRQRLLEFSNTAAMLGLPDLADIATKFQEFLVHKIKPEENEEAIGTLNFSIGALIEKMETQPYGPEFVSGLGEVLVYLDFYGEEPESSPELPARESASPAPRDLPKMTTVTESPTKESPAPEDGAVEVGHLPSGGKETRSIQEETGTLEISEQITEVPPSLTEDMESGVHAARREDKTISEIYSPQDTTPRETLAPQIHEKSETIPAPSVEGSPLDEGLVVRYRMLLEIDPTSRAFIALAEELSNRGLWNEAVETCRRGLVFHPNHLRAKALLGCALWELGDKDEAERTLLEARKDLEKNAILYRALADIAESRGEAHRAQHLQQVYESLRMGDGHAQSFGDESAPDETETKPETRPLESSSLAFLSALKARFEGKPEDRQMEEQGLFAAEDRDALKRILTSVS